MTPDLFIGAVAFAWLLISFARAVHDEPGDGAR